MPLNVESVLAVEPVWSEDKNRRYDRHPALQARALGDLESHTCIILPLLRATAQVSAEAFVLSS